jgi:hypothetical protein
MMMPPLMVDISAERNKRCKYCGSCKGALPAVDDAHACRKCGSLTTPSVSPSKELEQESAAARAPVSTTVT